MRYVSLYNGRRLRSNERGIDPGQRSFRPWPHKRYHRDRGSGKEQNPLLVLAGDVATGGTKSNSKAKIARPALIRSLCLRSLAQRGHHPASSHARTVARQ